MFRAVIIAWQGDIWEALTEQAQLRTTGLHSTRHGGACADVRAEGGCPFLAYASCPLMVAAGHGEVHKDVCGQVARLRAAGLHCAALLLCSGYTLA